MNPRVILAEATAVFNRNRNPEKAAEMSRYMKGLFPYFGIQKPLRKTLMKPLVAEAKKLGWEETESLLMLLWEQDERELQYLAMEILDNWKKKLPLKSIELIETLILSKSWWDTVDYLAVHPAGSYFQRFPDSIPKTTDRWNRSNNMWLNRSAILFQLNYRDKTDFALLCHFIETHRQSKEFFHQKAIGWALRQYARTNPEAVLKYVADTDLKPLSRREALKHFPDAG